MAEFPALPLWIEPLTYKTAHLDDSRFGLYMRLLILMWGTPGCRVPNDFSWIMNKLPGRTEEQLRGIVGEFCQSDGNWITQKRLQKEFAYVSKTTKKRSDAAKAKWRKQKEAYGADAPTPTPTPTHSSYPPSDIKPPAKWIEDDDDPAPAKPPKATRAHRLPDSWQPSEQLHQWALDQGLPITRFDRTLDSFRDYWKSTGKPRIDWAATFRNWVRKDLDQRLGGGNGKATGYTRQQGWAMVDAVIDEAKRRRADARADGASEAGGDANVVQLPGLRKGPA